MTANGRNTRSVCIYGVGRSGTKLVQLAACLGLARENGRCDVVYEPFHWATRTCTVASEPGIREHQRLPLFLSAAESANHDSRYLRAKTSPRGDVPLVCKFIRGNGRIRLIDRLASPDRTIVVLRSLVAVLDSLRHCHFDLLGKQQHYPSDAPRLHEEIGRSRDLPISNAFRDRCASTEELNALWWLAMNEAALAAVVDLRAAHRAVLVLDQRLLLEQPRVASSTLTDFLGLQPLDVPLESLCDPWIREEKVLRTDTDATTPAGLTETDDQPFRERIFCNLETARAAHHVLTCRDPAVDVAENPLYRQMNEALWQRVGDLPP
jgi:hypothetical protein